MQPKAACHRFEFLQVDRLTGPVFGGADFLAELNRLEGDEKLAGMLDLPRLRAALEDWPEQTVTDRFQSLSREMAVPRGLLTARFINWVEGRNQP